MTTNTPFKLRCSIQNEYGGQILHFFEGNVFSSLRNEWYLINNISGEAITPTQVTIELGEDEYLFDLNPLEIKPNQDYVVQLDPEIMDDIREEAILLNEELIITIQDEIAALRKNITN